MQGRDGEGLLAVGVGGKGLPGTWQLRCCGLGGSRPLPQGAGWLWWEQTVFTPSPHTLPTLTQPIPGPLLSQALGAICTFAALLRESLPLRLLLPLYTPSAQNSSPGASQCPGALPQPGSPLQEALTVEVPFPQPTNSHHIGQGMIFNVRGLLVNSWSGRCPHRG